MSDATPPASTFRRKRARVLLGATAAVALAVTGTVVATTASADASKTLTANGTGTHNGFYYSYWKDKGNVTMNLGAGGNYSVDIKAGTNNWVGGKGWKPGARRVVNYSGSWSTNGNGYLALYGWTTSPLVEYYIVENYGTYNPASQAQKFSSVTTDGAVYDVYRTQRVNQPSIEGTKTFYQYWSVRRNKRTGGQITVGNHFDAWTKAGLQLGKHDYQVMATEGYQSAVQSNITVSEASGTGNPQPTIQPTQQPTQKPTTGNGKCTATVSAGSSWSDRFNVNVAVSGSSNWTVTLTLAGSQRVMSSWNATTSSSGQKFVAKPNGAGNNFGVTIQKNGSTTMPSVSCSA